LQVAFDFDQKVPRRIVLRKLARKRGYRSPIHLAWDYAVLQRKEETVRALQDSFREHSPFLVFLEEEPVDDFLHSGPRYRALVAKMGLPALAPLLARPAN
jgi:hypothetical protein